MIGTHRPGQGLDSPHLHQFVLRTDDEGEEAVLPAEKGRNDDPPLLDLVSSPNRESCLRRLRNLDPPESVGIVLSTRGKRYKPATACISQDGQPRLSW